MKKALAILVLGSLAASTGFAAEPRSMRKGSTPLHMEELEVRGIREKPETLYLPVHAGIVLPTAVRYDLFRNDMTRPVLPGEVVPEALPAGRTENEGAYYD